MSHIIDRTPRVQRIINALVAVIGGAVLWAAHTGIITGDFIAYGIGALFLLYGIYGIYDPESTIPTGGSSGGGGW